MARVHVDDAHALAYLGDFHSSHVLTAYGRLTVQDGEPVWDR